MNIEEDIAIIKADLAKVKSWVQVHQWIWYVVAFVAGFLAKTLL